MTVSFLNGAAEPNLEQVENVRSNRSASGNDKLDVATQYSPDLVKHQAIVEGMCPATGLLEVGQFRLHSGAHQLAYSDANAVFCVSYLF